VSNEIPIGSMKLYARMVPGLSPGQWTVKVEQQVRADPTSSSELLVSLTDQFPIEVAGPRYKLSPADVLGMFPAPGTQEATDLRVPHIALRRRTLPWERAGDVPWMAMLLLEVTGAPSANGSMTLEGGATIERNFAFSPSDVGDRLVIPNALLTALEPTVSERSLLAHVRKFRLDDAEGEYDNDDDGQVAIVLGNRLPRPDRNYAAMLVSTLDRAALAGSKTALPVLHMWTYRTAEVSGDFQAWAEALAYNGAVRMIGDRARGEDVADGLGRIAVDHRERSGEPGTSRYRGPLSPVPLLRSPKIMLGVDAGRSYGESELDVSYAAAFELGRLLAMADRRVLHELMQFRRNQLTWKRAKVWQPRVPMLERLKQLPVEKLLGRLTGDWVMRQLLTKGDLVTNPGNTLLGRLGLLRTTFGLDRSGVEHLIDKLPGLMPVEMGQLFGKAIGDKLTLAMGLGPSLGLDFGDHGMFDQGFDVGIGAADVFDMSTLQLAEHFHMLELQNMEGRWG
jgi:hypothetical protein